MFKAVLLTFIVTSLLMTVTFLLCERKRQMAEKKALKKRNDELRQRISDYENQDRHRREQSAYDKGLYDGRTTDTFYRQCLKKLTTREQADVMMNGEQEES